MLSTVQSIFLFSLLGTVTGRWAELEFGWYECKKSASLSPCFTKGVCYMSIDGDAVTYGCLTDDLKGANPFVASITTYREEPCQTDEDTGRLWCLCQGKAGTECNDHTHKETFIKENQNSGIAHNEPVYMGEDNYIQHAYQHVTPETLVHATEFAYDYISKLGVDSKMYAQQGIDYHAKPGETRFLHESFMKADPKSLTYAYGARLYEEAAKKYTSVSGYSYYQCILLQEKKLRPHFLKACPFPSHNSLKCSCSAQTRFRTIDGRCNNLEYPLWGSAHIPQRRYIHAQYDNQLESPRQRGKDGDLLPSARTVSLAIHRPDTAEDPPTDSRFTYMVMQWGQFVDHDIVHTPVSKGYNNTNPSCCFDDLDKTKTDWWKKIQIRPECFPINLPADDPYYSHYGKTCINFVRSVPSPNLDCVLGYREQLNELTSYIDASNVYGASLEVSDSLRTFEGGKMKIAPSPTGYDTLPKDDENKQGCLLTEDQPFARCRWAGDIRVNEQPALTAIHTIWIRMHNKIAEKLLAMNSRWSDERLYQETRKIIAALMQHITYNEFLSVMITGKDSDKYNLKPKTAGYFTEYNKECDSTIRNEFAGAAFRVGHTLVSKKMAPKDTTYTPVQLPTDLSKCFFAPYLSSDPKSTDEYIRTLASDPLSKCDAVMTGELIDKLFLDVGTGHGLDLAALNIQRGRDHGLPPYNIVRRFCQGTYGDSDEVFLAEAATFDDLNNTHSQEMISKFQTVYSDVADIDLFSGAISEKPLAGVILGPTLSCIIGKQFSQLKAGDRFFYETNQRQVRFLLGQLQAIRNVKMSSVICETTDTTQIQEFVFEAVDGSNPRKPCDMLSKLDLSPWGPTDMGADYDAHADLSADDNSHL